jgi:hypothetical protein
MASEQAFGGAVAISSRASWYRCLRRSQVAMSSRRHPWVAMESTWTDRTPLIGPPVT